MEILTKFLSNPWNWIDIHKNTAEDYLAISKCSTSEFYEPSQNRGKLKMRPCGLIWSWVIAKQLESKALFKIQCHVKEIGGQ